jgi:hypothetical protein
MFAKGLPGNPGDPAVSTRASRRQRIEAPAQFRRGAGNSNSPLPGDEQQCVVPPGRTKGSGAGRMAGSRSALVIPVKLANCRPREPVEGSAESRNRWKETQRDIVLEMFCVNATSTNSGSGLPMQQTRDSRAGCGNPARPELQGGRGEQSPRSTRPDRARRLVRWLRQPACRANRTRPGPRRSLVRLCQIQNLQACFKIAGEE